MDEIIKTIDNYINNVNKKLIKLGFGCGIVVRKELEAEIDRLKKLKKLCEEKLNG